MSDLRKMTLRLSRWLAHWAGTFGAWSWKLEAHATRNDPPCPDCGEPEVHCYCAERADEKREFDAAYTAGFFDAEDLYGKSA